MKTKKSFYASVVLIIGISIAANIISTDFFLRLDLTENQRFTLSAATEDIVDELVEPVTVKAYFSENLPPNVAQTRQDFKDLLVEYASLSNGNLVYEFINPNEDAEKEQEAAQAGVSPVMINVREKDQVKQQKAFLGAVIEMGEQKDVIPFMQPGEAMEYALTTSIKKLAVIDKPAVGLIQGHGEPSVADMQQAAQALSILYNFEDVTLSGAPIPDKYKTLVLVAPTDTIPASHLSQLDDFMARGGKLLIAMNKVDGDLQNATGNAIFTGLAPWLQQKSVTVENKFLTDANCASVTVQQQQGAFRFQSRVQFPFLPILTNFADHPITKGLEQVVLPFASPISFAGDTAVNFTPLAFSSNQSGSATAPTYFDIQRQWSEADFPLSNQAIAAAVEGTIAKGSYAKMVVIGDGDFAINVKDGGQPQPVQEDNVSLLVNAIDWLSDDTGLIDLRTKGVSSRPLDPLEDSTKATLKWLNFGLPILLAILYGFIRAQIRRMQRIKRMEVSYE